MTREREEEIRKVAAELAAVIDELEAAVEALRAMQPGPGCEKEEEGDPV